MDWTRGYTASELDRIQSRFDLRFPPDLLELYLERRPAKGHDWLGPEKDLLRWLQWPLEGLVFDLHHNNLWMKKWGDRPSAMADRENRLRELVRQAPKLIPIYSHRFIPETPTERGNPILSVHQSDIIYYGANLADYFRREGMNATDIPWPPIKRVPFWSDVIEDYGEDFSDGGAQLSTEPDAR